MKKEKSQNVIILNEIQKILHNDVTKKNGFKKSGRTLNKTVDENLVEVINFQSGHYPIGNYEIPGIRESLYGFFTINLGIRIPEIDEIERGNINIKKFYQEYDCHIRCRLGTLYKKEDIWWSLDNDIYELSDKLKDILEKYALPFFEDFSSRDLITKNIEKYKKDYSIMTRNLLDISFIYYKMNKKDIAERFFKEHYNKSNNHKPHQKYLEELAIKLGFKL